MDGGTMIKRKVLPIELDAYVCDNCIKEMPGLPLICYYPYGHVNDSMDGPSHFCSDKCLVEFEQKITKKYGFWKSTPIVEKVRASEEGAKTSTRLETPTEPGDTPKARRGSKKTRKPRASEKRNDLL